MESLEKKAIAFFDVDGTLLKSTIVHYYIWLRTASLSRFLKFFWLIGFLPKIVYYLILDRFSRTQFNRVFYQNYRGMNAEQIKTLATDMFCNHIRQKIFPAAVTQIQEHKEQGDYVVLVTGSLDFIVQPIAAHLEVDAVLAPQLAEQDGKFTGELTTAPLIGEQKVTALTNFADQTEIPLALCYAYSDSQSDLPMLNCVGYPAVVNPSKSLRQKAFTEGWEMHEWM